MFGIPHRAAALLAAAALMVVWAGGAFPLFSGEPDAAAEATPNTGVEGWASEMFYNRENAQMGILQRVLSEDIRPAASAVAEVAGPGFSCPRLRPDSLRKVYADGTRFSVWRAAPDADKEEERARYQGVSGFAAALGDLLQPLAELSDIRIELKTVGVEIHGDEAGTSLFFHAAGRSADRAVQQNAIWHCRWVRGEGSAPPKLAGITAEGYEEVHLEGAPGSLFTDCTESVLGADPSYRTRLLPGPAYWWGRLESSVGVTYHGLHGIAVGDVNGDGLDDLYVCQPGGVPNSLLIHQPDGTAVDVAAEAGVDWLDYSEHALLVDLDGDGDEDLVVSLREHVVFMANDGKGRFAERQRVFLTPHPGSLSVADYDGDGDLDLYVCRYSNDAGVEIRRTSPVPYYDANNGAPNVLLRNDGEWNFQDATAGSGLERNNSRFSFASSWEDFDGDGDPDLYVANDFGRNNLYRNDGGHFTDVAAEAGVEDIAAGMGVSWGDVNRDGRPDLYVADMYSGAGNRVTTQQEFQKGTREDIRSLYRRHARGNSLFLNAGEGRFVDASVDSRVTMGRWAWGSQILDVNNDGWQDMVVLNGYVTNEDPRDL